MPSEDQLDQLEQLDAFGRLDHPGQLHQLPAQFLNTGLVKVMNTSLKPTISTKGKAELVFLNIFNHHLMPIVKTDLKTLIICHFKQSIQ